MIDPLVAEGPLRPVESLRPLENLQRLLLLDGLTPMMVDLETGDIRPWENGPPVSVPMVSTAFDLNDYDRVQVQILRDPRPTSVDAFLLAAHPSGGQSIDVVETADHQLVIRHGGTDVSAGPIGSSLAIVVTLTPDRAARQLAVSARNAETFASITATTALDPFRRVVLTVGGPSTEASGTYGRRRLVPAHVEAVRHQKTHGSSGRTATLARRVVSAVRDRIR